jgi:predicted pyridoxine 5'-phosphate oxidase superfamily flavin-nucleotide-binding protein
LVVRARPSGSDPLVETLAPGAAIGLLGIELPTRRRNRANGRVTTVTPDEFRVDVVESFGNCPKYIQTRALQPAPVAPRPEPALDATGHLTDWARRMVEGADTVFVASYVEAERATPRMIDVSHRGGRSGFIRADAAGTLTFPDFTGNFLFNTLGNLLSNPRAGLVVPDFRSGDLLYVSGDTDIVWDGSEVAAVDGADRLWRLRPVAGSGMRAAIPLRGDVIEYSPHLP